VQENVVEVSDKDDVGKVSDAVPLALMSKKPSLLNEPTKTCDKLSAWEIVQIARHPDRPILPDYIDMITKDFLELHGDRFFGDDKAIMTGFARIDKEKVMIIGHNKGKSISQKTACNFGYAHPEGYRKALIKMKLAEKFHLPIVCLVDTPGAYPGIGAEERGQARAIAVNLMEMSRLRTPIVCVVIGEGGSGGAIGIGVADRFAMMQFAYYTVISPEACAVMLWKNIAKAPEAAQALKLTSKDVLNLGIADHIISEPLGGAHNAPKEAAINLQNYIVQTIQALQYYKTKNLVERRYQKLRSIGRIGL